VPPSARPLELPESGSDTIELQNLLSTRRRTCLYDGEAGKPRMLTPARPKTAPTSRLEVLGLRVVEHERDGGSFGVLSAPRLNPGALQ
jgi:hypothetical protein